MVHADEMNLRNRLLSIHEDATFVEKWATAHPRVPLVANLRCGKWYVPLEEGKDAVSCYFKSTDGHTGTWDFNLRRLNLHVAKLAASRGVSGVAIIDSTRKARVLLTPHIDVLDAACRESGFLTA